MRDVLRNYGIKRHTKRLPFLSREELLYTINQAPSLRDRALISILYVTGARVSEIVGNKVTPPLIKKQLGAQTVNGIKFLCIFGLHTLKGRTVKKRTIYIRIDTEKFFCDIINEYCLQIGEDEPLFKMQRVQAWGIVNKWTTYFPHYFRHLRATHLVTMYKFNNTQLKEFFGWSNSNLADFYVRLHGEDLAHKMTELV